MTQALSSLPLAAFTRAPDLHRILITVYARDYGKPAREQLIDMVGAFTIRRCTASDAPALASLGARLFTETYGPTHPEPELSRYLARSFSVEDVRLSISDDDVSMFMVEDSSGVPIAYAYLRATSEPPGGVDGRRPFEIVRFYVDGARQGRGVGAALMEACFRDAKDRGADAVWLQVWKEAPWAVGFYQRMGFSVVGSAPFYFGDRIGDDHIMSRSLLVVSADM